MDKVSNNVRRNSHHGSQHLRRPRHRKFLPSRLPCSHRRNAEVLSSEAEASNNVWRRLRRQHRSRHRNWYRRRQLYRRQDNVKGLNSATKMSLPANHS